MLYGNTDKIKEFKEFCDKYDMTNVLMIPTLVNSGDTNYKDRWGGPETRLCMLNHWYKFPF